ncbi:MAG: DNA replication/repair protein RecF [Solirubrobacteraceae bacterium]
MRLEAVELRDFRSYELENVAFGEGLTVVHGRNGAGKSNLLEAVCFGCTGRSPRTRNERELIRFGAAAARVTLTLRDDRRATHSLAVGFGRLEQGGRLEKRFRFDGAPLGRLDDAPERPLAIVFVPDRLELVAGQPAIRRAHLDHLSAALWPARAGQRGAYSRSLAQRNALVARIRSGAGSIASLASWNRTLASDGLMLMRSRSEAVGRLASGFASLSKSLGLAGGGELVYRPASAAETVEELEAELERRLASDVERGYTTHGPHRDELAFLRCGRQLRSYGSQGERRLTLLALLLAERAAIAQSRGAPPVMLLDDVMSELDERRRRLLVDELLASDGQSQLASTELAHVPRSARAELAVHSDGATSVVGREADTAARR